MPSLDDLIDTFEARVEVAMARLGAAVRARARATAPYRTGTLQRSIVVERTGAAERDVIAGVPYAVYVEQKTGFMDAAIQTVLPRAQSFFDEAFS